MVDKIKTILEKITKEKGATTLFALLKMDELVEKWNVIVCAPWINPNSVKENFTYLANEIFKELTEEEKASIARIGIFAKNEVLIKELLRYKAGTVIDAPTKINGNTIHEGYILASNG